jgi:hypothetical protein
VVRRSLVTCTDILLSDFNERFAMHLATKLNLLQTSFQWRLYFIVSLCEMATRVPLLDSSLSSHVSDFRSVLPQQPILRIVVENEPITS